MNLLFLKTLLRRKPDGFILPLTLFVCMILLSIATSISVLLAKEVYFSRLTRLSQVAYYAADDGLMCAAMIDDKFIDPDTGLGIFPYDINTTAQSVLDKINAERAEDGLPQILLNDIKCATSAIFDSAVTGLSSEAKSFSVGGTTQDGVSTTFSMRMDLGGGDYRCASVSINKTPAYRQIISRGFASCTTVSAFPIERAVVSTSVNSYYDPVVSTGQTAYVLTSGSSWQVPLDVTSIKVWAVGAGGGGAGTPVSSGNTAGGAGAGGGVAYKTYAVLPGQMISYSVGASGVGASGGSDGANGGQTTVTVGGQLPLTATGGEGGNYNSTSIAFGGDGFNGDFMIGGDGEGSSGNSGGAGGGGTGAAMGSSVQCSGANGAQGGDVDGMFAVVTAAGYPTVGPGSRGSSNCSSPIVDTEHGTDATGFGSGGGGAGRSGGNGGDGLYGGGGGGAAGGNTSHTGGNGGSGAVVISIQ